MNCTPIRVGWAVVLGSMILVVQGCQKEQDRPNPPPVQTATATPRLSASTEPSAAPAGESDEQRAARLAIEKCCAILQYKLDTTPTDQVSAYSLALGVCKAIKGHRKGKAALAKVRKALGETPVPALCR